VANYVALPETFSAYFLNFVYCAHSAHAHNYVLRSYIAYAFVNLVRARALGDRSVAPTVAQLKDVLKLRRVAVRVYFTHERYVEAYAELYETAEELKYRLVKWLGLPEASVPLLALYEVNETDAFFDESFVEDFVRVADVLASWQHNYFAASTGDAPGGSEGEGTQRADRSRLYLRFRYFSEAEDASTVLKSVEDDLCVCEVWRLIAANRILLDKESLYSIIAMCVKMRYARIGVKYLYAIIDEIEGALRAFGANSNLCVTASAEKILRRLRAHEDADAATVRGRLLALVRTNPCYKTQHFAIYVDDAQVAAHGLAPEMVLLVGARKLFFCKVGMARVRVVRYEQLRTMHVHKESVVLGVSAQPRLDALALGSDDAAEKIVFRCNQAATLYNTIKNYVQLRISGTFKNAEARISKAYKDVGDVVIDQQLIDRVLTKKIMVENINRFYKHKLD